MRLKYSDFEPLLNQTFQIEYGNGETLPVTLAEVAPGKNPSSTDENGEPYYPFSLIFQSGITDYLPQAAYRIEHDQLGSHDIFIVPLGPNAQGMRYQAVFS
jgi:hypothetical protein